MNKIRVLCTSPVDKLEYMTAGNQTIQQFKKMLSETIEISVINFRVVCLGELCPLKIKLQNLPKDPATGMLILTIEFNETEKARKEVIAHERKLGLPPKGIQKTLLSLLEDFDQEIQPNKQPVREQTTPKNLRTIFKKKESYKDKGIKELKNRAKFIDNNLAKA